MELSDRDIARWRLHAQRLIGQPAAGPVDVVRHLLAVQAENYAQATWAVGARSRPTTQADLDERYSAGAILRTHVLRTTWHFVEPGDIGWLCALTGPRLRPIYASQQRQLGVSEAVMDGALGTIAEAIERGGPQTRAQVREHLEGAGIATDGVRLTLITATAEAAGLLCSGPLSGGEHTHDLIARRAPGARRLDRPEALAELAWRYLAGHGPATEGDLSYWATLTRRDARAGLTAAGERLATFDHDGRRYWYARDSEPDSLDTGGAHLLQILDEIYRGFQDSRWVLDADQLLGRGREPSTGMALLDGQVAGTMARTVSPTTIELTVTPYRPISAYELDRLTATAQHYGRFVGRTPALRIAPLPA